ncbi:MAG: leucine--tRNA ligase [Candidatus Ventricola sp.]|nr:leucine--tRNA ligase [Clostridiales bacterium]MDY4542510.1 leucine--tRNA ligase [Candidatus Ventricola sp.]
MKPYNPEEIELKWQKNWDEAHCFEAKSDKSKPKFYGLIEFPYPSGAGLHVGHPRSNTAMDIIARKRRMEGYNVLYPIGWDAFGLPTENYAIKNHVHPAGVTQKNIDHFREQLKRIGFSFDWSREVNTTDPNYFKWTQWIFLQLYKHGLAYKSEMPVNWCPSCKCGLANEEVVAGKCERCGAEVIRRVKSQWMLKITKYAQKLLDGLDDVDFIEKVKVQQRNWIGRSEGAEVDFKIADSDMKLRVYTTRPDTLFGATYMVVAPEHAAVDALKDRITNWDDVIAYREAAARKSEFERTELAKDKTGVELKGIRAINPVNGKDIPIFISDYVLVTYGTGAIMAVPAHDTRDWDFAKKFNLPIIEVVAGGEDVQKEAYTDVAEGVLCNSGFLNGLSVAEAKKSITQWLTENGVGEKKVNYKLRDWVFSRQRYWGEPIPLVYCEKCGWVPVPEDQLPVLLPEVDNYEPTDSGESPLSKIDSWVNTTCPCCGGPAKRETDTMPQWAGSSWYFLRYADPHCDTDLARWEELAYWLPVDWYNGGMEHTTLHLLYSRFWNLFLYDIGVIPNKEPYQKRTSHGMILGANGEKMSKSRGNVINPDETIAEIGADAFRLYEMFMGAFDQAIPWSTEGARGCRRFLERVWRLQEMLIDEEGVRKEMEVPVNAMIKKVSEDYERMKFNTAIAAMMAFVNDVYTNGKITRGELKALCLCLNPVAPHITEEMWEACGFGTPIYTQSWPTYDENKLVADEVEIAVQIKGKVRARIMVPAGLTQADGEKLLENETVKKLVGDAPVRKLIFVPGRLLNIVC